jgi:hypothetical protein
MVVPAGHVSLDYTAALVDHDDRVWIDVRLQIYASEFARAAEIVNDAETIAKVVGNEERVAVGTDCETTWIDRRAIAVVTR